MRTSERNSQYYFHKIFTILFLSDEKKHKIDVNKNSNIVPILENLSSFKLLFMPDNR